MKEIVVQEYSTFFKVPKIDGIYYSEFTRVLSIANYFTGDYEPYGYQITKNFYRCMKIPKGILINALRECGLKANIVRQPDIPYADLSKPYNMKNEPIDDIQKNVIAEVVDTFKSGDTRAIVSLKTGKGKTYVATNIIHKLRVKALIMVKTVELRNQWLESFRKHTDIKNIWVIENTSELEELITDNKFNPDVIVCTHKSMALFIDKVGAKGFGYMLAKLGIGIKVYDEFDLENASMFNMDMLSSIRYNLYLSATDYKSSEDANYVFQKIFKGVHNVGKEYASDTKRNAIFVLFNSYPTSKESAKCMQYGPNGLTFSYAKYHMYAATKFGAGSILKSMWKNFIKPRYDDKLKTVFFIGRKTTAELFKAKLLEAIDNDVDASEISILNSDTPEKDREGAMKKYLIISTSNSLGRGIDLTGLDTIVDFETRNSKSATAQVVGRVSRTGMKNVGTYIQLVDYGFPTVIRNYERKLKGNFFDEFFTDIKIKNNLNKK